MNLNVRFSEKDQSFKPKFGEVFNISDGGYERGYAEGYDKGEADGYTAGQADGYEQGVIKSWQYVASLVRQFQGVTFPDGYELTLNVPNLAVDRTIDNVISGAKGLRKLTIKCGREDVVLRSYFAFGSCTVIEEIDLSQFSNTEVVRVTDANYMFYATYKLHTVVGVLDFTGCANQTNAFSGASGLVNVRILAGSISRSLTLANSPNLSDASIQSIVDGLADLTGQTSQAVSFHTNVILKLTDEQYDAITAKNWTF